MNWTQKDISGIFGKVVLEYQECMKKYKMRTGGGPGVPQNFAKWETRDESCILFYTQQDANLYLTVVHIWDKLYGFLFVPTRDPMPDKCMIDDPVDFEYEEEEEDDCNSNPVLRTPLPGEATATQQSSRKIQSKSVRKKQGSNLFWRR